MEAYSFIIWPICRQNFDLVQKLSLVIKLSNQLDHSSSINRGHWKQPIFSILLAKRVDHLIINY